MESVATTLRVDDMEIAVEIVGSGTESVLLVHGLGANRDCWYRAAEFFDLRRFRLIKPDFPGFGDSGRPPSYAYTMRDFGDCLYRVVTMLEVDRLHVVAHSMGCVAALSMLEHYRVPLASFVAAEGNLVPEDAFMSSKVARLGETAFVRCYTKWLTMVRESLGDAPNEQHDRFVESLRRASPVAVHRASLSCNERTRSGALSAQFGELGCPLAYVYGESTPNHRPLPEVVMRPHVERKVIPGQGHFMMEAAEPFYSWLAHWLSSLATARH